VAIDVFATSLVLRENAVNVKEKECLLQKIGGREENGNGNEEAGFHTFYYLNYFWNMQQSKSRE
jgi:hypothetical protein